MNKPSPQPVWEVGSLAASGLRADFAAKLDAAMAGPDLAGLHAVLLAKGGKLIFERYLSGIDQRWGSPLGTVSFTPDTLHDLRSVSKSVVALLYGIALRDGLVPAPGEPLLAQFPEYPDLQQLPHLAALKVSHVLGMSLGLEWNEDLPYSDPANSEIAMENAVDRYRFVLERPFVTGPGQAWTYCGGASALLGRLIEKGSGRGLLEVANEKLFAPLGIVGADWVTGGDGAHSAASGLRLRSRDLARIGQVVLQQGLWQGREIIPASWLEAAFTPGLLCFDEVHYGYQWYLRDAPDGHGKRIFAMGNGGQRLILLP